MKNVIIAPDSFKGTLSSVEVCSIISEALRRRYEDIDITHIPVADGGEGTVEAFLCAVGGRKVYCTAKSPLLRDIEVYYGILNDGTAVIEMAQASGISIEEKNDAMRASSFGTGQMIAHALDQGCRKIIIGIGGSATTDGGIGAAAALGASFTDKNGEKVPLCGEGLACIEKIELSGIDKRIFESEITVLCDVTNTLYGEVGAAFVYSPQKGADKNQVELLDKGLRNLAQKAKTALDKDYSFVEGAGAAGGLGFGLVAFMNGRLRRGIDCVLEVARFSEKVKYADAVITGEGKLDAQSLMGKVPFGVAEKSCGKRVIAVVGVSEIDASQANGISEIIQTNSEQLPFDVIKHRAAQMLEDACEKIIL